jgi:hypothetical protein
LNNVNDGTFFIIPHDFQGFYALIETMLKLHLLVHCQLVEVWYSLAFVMSGRIIRCLMVLTVVSFCLRPTFGYLNPECRHVPAIWDVGVIAVSFAMFMGSPGFIAVI